MTVVRQTSWRCTFCGHSWPAPAADDSSWNGPCPACQDGKPQSWTNQPSEDFIARVDGPGHWMDSEVRRSNKASSFELCARCDGTGNELHSMYKACTACGGSGRARDVA